MINAIESVLEKLTNEVDTISEASTLLEEDLASVHGGKGPVTQILSVVGKIETLYTLGQGFYTFLNYVDANQVQTDPYDAANQAAAEAANRQDMVNIMNQDSSTYAVPDAPSGDDGNRVVGGGDY